ncbi:MAG: response regulator [Lachnospiraceae bacterium]|nr:response regulator [Lachnospiraceae bacterium]
MREVVRCPAGYDKNGRLYFMAQVREGDVIRLSYASPRRMVSDLRAYVNEMKAFSPQALFLIICENRGRFLGELSAMDVRSFQSVSEELSWVRGFAEIVQDKSGGGVVNSALLAVGFREGEAAERASEVPLQEPEEEEDKRGEIPLNERMATFLEEITREMGELAVDADAANKAKTSFLSNMSHEIRTPINAILGMNEMILRESADQAIISCARDVENAGINLLGLINDILDLSKIEAGKLQILPADYEISSLIGYLMNMIRARSEARGLKLKLDMNASLPRVLNGDEIRIKQIITNILTNAVKYTEYGSVTLKVDFEKRGSSGILLKVAVSDTGIGIREEDIEKLFTAFDRIEEERNRVIEGTGLGLNITSRLLEMMGSSLKVESIYGEGSTFSFELLQGVSDWTEIGDSESAIVKRGGEHGGKELFQAPDARILVVDDTPMNLSVITNLLRRTKIGIDTARSGSECLELFKKEDYDLIFLDHRMPDMDGVETLQRLREIPKKGSKSIPVICLTANAVSGAREEYIKAGFTDYVTKPVSSEHLEGTLLRYLPENKVVKTDGISVPEKEVFEDGDISALPAWLKLIHALDLKAALDNCGSAEGLMEVLEIFFSSAAEKAEELGRYVERGSWQDFTIKVHALKSMARTIGARELSSAAAALEEAGDSGNIEYIRKHTPGFLRDYRELGEALRPIEEAGDKKEAEELPLITKAELDDALMSLREIALSFDYDSMVMIMDSLSGYSFPEEERERMEELRSAVGIPDWDRIKKALS